jgi:two-component system invasion response regulator UvrY
LAGRDHAASLVGMPLSRPPPRPRPAKPPASSVDGGPVSVLAVDDQAVFRRIAGALVQASEGFELVGEASSGEEAIARVAELQPDMVLLDVRMPGLDGIETARRLVHSHPGTMVVLMSVEDLVDLPLSAVSVGAAAHVRKQELSPRKLRALWARHGERP